MKKEDLIVLQYSPNVCYVQVVSVKEARKESRLEIDLKNSTWRLDNSGKGVAIGEGIPNSSSRSPKIIGVYDRTQMEHLNSMVHDATEATREYNDFSDD